MRAILKIIGEVNSREEAEEFLNEALEGVNGYTLTSFTGFVEIPSEGNQPVPMKSHDIAVLLRDMAFRVEQHDSFEGSISYEMPEETPEDAYAMVRGTYRIGNTMGQGGMRIIGTMGLRDDETPGT